MLAAALPIIIHLINRRRARRVPFAAIYFVQLSNRRLARSLKLKQILLLALRTLLLLLIPLLLARPYRVPPVTAQPDSSVEPTNRIILLDRSLSMQAVQDKEILFERARARVRELVATFSERDMLALVGAPIAEGQEPVGLSFDRYALLDALDAMKPSMRRTDFSQGLDRVRLMLDGATLARHRLYIVGDFTQIGYDVDFALTSATGPVAVTLIDVRDPKPLPNRALGHIEAERSFFTGLNDWKISVSAMSFGAPAEGVPISIRSGDRELASGFLDIPENEFVTKSFIVRFADAGRQQLLVRIPDDALAADNQRFAVVTVSRSLSALVVNGRPSTTRHKDEIFYLREALNPGDLNQSRIHATIITPERLSVETLQGMDLVFMANVPTLNDEQAEALLAFVEQGGGLFIGAGPAVDVDAYNARLSALLPGQLRGERLAGTGTDTRSAGQVAYLSSLDYTHPAFRVFSDDTAHSLYIAPVRKYLTFDADAGRGKQILARFSDNSPALVEVLHGKGRSLLFTSSFSRTWSDIPIQPGFLPLVQELARYLAGQSGDEADRSLLVGAHPPIPEGVLSPVLIAPDGRKLKPAAGTNGGPAAFNPLNTPGIYTLTAPDLDEALAVNIDPSESDLRQLDEQQRQLAFGMDVQSAGSGGALLPDQRIEYAGMLIWLILLAFAGEVLVLRWMG
jgi:hypothetical protein